MAPCWQSARAESRIDLRGGGKGRNTDNQNRASVARSGARLGANARGGDEMTWRQIGDVARDITERLDEPRVLKITVHRVTHEPLVFKVPVANLEREPLVLQIKVEGIS